ncbi:MAG TPA: ATP-binding cassette domain-containing protein [Candidatus Binatia bacterium]|nr:ATP-binding cassette domain-containing protein [Candidatus Binatia bacterium]
MEIIKTRGLSKNFGEVCAVSKVNLAVNKGEVVGLIGPNGAGKTTLIHLLTGLLDPTAGDAKVLGFDTVREADAIAERMGYVSQEFTLYGTLTVEENLDFFADLHRVPWDLRETRKTDLLNWSRLEGFRRRRAAQLSGGMQKKLHLCCALIHRPEILFLDEPTTGVDPVSRRELWEILYDLVAQGLTLIVATPYMDEAERCHRVILMHQGKILRSGSPADLRESLDETVLELRADPLLLAKDVLSRASIPFRCYVMGDRLHILARRDNQILTEVTRILGNGGVRVESLRRITPSIEDVFLKLTDDKRKGTPGLAPAGRGDARIEQQKPGDALQLEGLTKAFGDFVAVDGISLAVKRGEIFGFLGPNGSGKTTTIRMLCGLLLPTSGRGRVLGIDVTRGARKIKQRVGYMSQRFSLYQELTAGENIDFFAGGYGVAEPERKRMAVEMARLDGLDRRPVRQLSSGVKQRLALVCALLHQPEILFLDEPTAGVDPSSRREFWDLIKELASHGTTIFVTTHYLDEAENCHRLGLVYRGKLIAVGSPRELKEGMKSGAMLEIECGDILKALHLLRPVVSHIGIFGNRLHGVVDDSNKDIPKLRLLLGRAGITVERIEEIPFSLEDLFSIFVEMEEQGRTEARA